MFLDHTQRRTTTLYIKYTVRSINIINPLNPELNPICYLLALLAHHFLHVSRIRVKSLTLRLLIYIYMEHLFLMFLDHTQRRTTTLYIKYTVRSINIINPLNPELNPICYLLALLAHHFLHVSRIRVKSLTLRLLIHIYGAPILDVSRSYTTTHHSR